MTTSFDFKLFLGCRKRPENPDFLFRSRFSTPNPMNTYGFFNFLKYHIAACNLQNLFYFNIYSKGGAIFSTQGSLKRNLMSARSLTERFYFKSKRTILSFLKPIKDQKNSFFLPGQAQSVVAPAQPVFLQKSQMKVTILVVRKQQ